MRRYLIPLGAFIATLTTDTGLTVQATKWDATPGGHHVPGK